MTTPTPTLLESAADVVPDEREAAAAEVIWEMFCQRMGGPFDRHQETIAGRSCFVTAREALKRADALASRSTQPEGKELGRISFELWSSGAFYGKTWEELMPGTKEFWARQEVLHGVAWASAGLKRKDDLLPQPEAAASGDVGRLVEAAKEVLSFRVEGPTRGWLRDNGASRAALQKLADALIPQPSAPAGEWMLIETAPKDGTEFDAWDAESEVRALCRWGKHNHVPIYGWIRQVELYGEEVDGFDATHWRPLPAPPRHPEPGSTQGGKTR